MEASAKHSKDADREQAEKFYDQALLLVDCCKIPEAVTLLDQAVKLDPNSELYRETLEFLHTSGLTSTNSSQKGEQESSYASVTRSKLNIKYDKENTHPNEWKTKHPTIGHSGSRGDCPTGSSSTRTPASFVKSTIDHPWASYMQKNLKRKKNHTSHIDSLSEIYIPPGNDMCFTQGTSCNLKDDSDQEEIEITSVDACEGSEQTTQEDERPVVFPQVDHCTTPETNISSCTDSEEPMFRAGAPVEFVQDNLVDNSDGVDHHKKSKCLENSQSHCNDQGVSFDSKFVQELCNARESVTDEWTEYYDVLCDGLNDSADSNHSDALRHTLPLDSDPTDTLDEINDSKGIRHKDHSLGNHIRSNSVPCASNRDACSKCEHLQTNANSLATPTKTRIHFVKGACVSSTASPSCTSHQERKNGSKDSSVKSPMSQSEQDFYRNLKYYFGAGKVKSRKAEPKTENREISEKKERNKGTVEENLTNTSSFGTVPDESLREDQIDSQSDIVNEREMESERSKADHIDVEVKDNIVPSSDAKSLHNNSESENNKNQKSCRHEKIRPPNKRPKSNREKDGGKTKVPSKNGHVNNLKEGASQSHISDRNKLGVKGKTRVDSNVKCEKLSRPELASEVREKLKQRQKQRRAAHPEVNGINAFLNDLYFSGVTVLSKCWEILKSILYYIFVLFVLILSFLICGAWFTICWLIRNLVYYTALDRLAKALTTRMSSVFAWFKKRATLRRKPSSQGKTYDLPQNGDAAIKHMLQNKDADPYSVLGVPDDASDDDIRKQYRRLAVLIHPDKNPDKQAAEAFQILSNSFDILGDPVKRSNYDTEMAWKRREERRENFGGHRSPEQFFADLGKKMQEMQNYLHCNQCDGKHRRYKTDRFILTARYCRRCNTRHAAKEGDLWAESSFFGFKLHFYACMEGDIFDVTDWAACQGLGKYRSGVDPHTVYLKLQTLPSHHGGFPSRSEDEDLENFFRSYFDQFTNPREERNNGPQKQARPKKRKKKR